MSDGASHDTELAHDQLVADVFARACQSRQILEHVTGRWGSLALAALSEGPYRFNALRRKVDGVSEKMLAQTLQALERDGFVHREAEPTIPPRVEYSLTQLGREVAAKLLDLIEYVEDRVPEVNEARARYDERRGERGAPAAGGAPAVGGPPAAGGVLDAARP